MDAVVGGNRRKRCDVASHREKTHICAKRADVGTNFLLIPTTYKFSSTAFRYFQNSSTDVISTRSLGLCGLSICGPKEIICMPGYFSPMTPHSSPACMAISFGSLPKVFL